MEGHVTILEGDALVTFLRLFGIETPSDALIYRVRIYQAEDASHVKVKVNEFMWTYGLGRQDGAPAHKVVTDDAH